MLGLARVARLPKEPLAGGLHVGDEIEVRTRTHALTHGHEDTHARTRAHTLTHTHTHTHTHTGTHTIQTVRKVG